MNRAAYFYRGIRRLVWAVTVIWIGLCGVVLVGIPVKEIITAPSPADIAAAEQAWQKELDAKVKESGPAPGLPPGGHYVNSDDYYSLEARKPYFAAPPSWESVAQGATITVIIGLLSTAAAAVLLWIIRGFLPIDVSPPRIDR